MTANDVAVVVRGMTPVVREYVASQMAGMLDLIAGLETRVLEAERRALTPGKDGRDGVDGKDGLAGLAGPAGRDGNDGKDGAQGVIGSAGERGLDGLNGKDGRDGIDGKDGALGLLGPMGPIGERGLDGRDGKDGRDGLNGKDGSVGLQGEKGLDGVNGNDGRDGFGFDDLTVTAFDPETRSFTLTFIKGEDRRVFPVQMPVPLDRGVWDEKRAYVCGDVVSYGGNMWIAQVETKQVQPGTSDTWRLSVRRGRDGKQGPIGPIGQKGDPGPQGNRGPDRW